MVHKDLIGSQGSMVDCESILGKINRSALFLSLGFLCRFSCMLLENRSSMRLLIKVFEVAQYLMFFFMTDEEREKKIIP